MVFGKLGQATSWHNRQLRSCCAATTTHHHATSNTTWTTGNRKSVLQSTSEDVWKPKEAQSNQSSHVPAASYVPKTKRAGRSIFKPTKTFFKPKTFQNVFKRFLKPKPTFRQDAGLLSIATGLPDVPNRKCPFFVEKTVVFGSQSGKIVVNWIPIRQNRRQLGPNQAKSSSIGSQLGKIVVNWTPIRQNRRQLGPNQAKLSSIGSQPSNIVIQGPTQPKRS